MKAIETLIDRYQIRLDVAAATIMAIAGSAPEIFISFFSVLLTGSDLGLGTILGSGAFNSMCLIGICGVVASQSLNLHWWPLVRDFFFYSLLLSLLAAGAYDGVIKYWEALLLLLVYIIY